MTVQPDPAYTRPRRIRRRVPLFWVLVAILLYAAIEAMAYLAFYAIHREQYTAEMAAALRAEATAKPLGPGSIVGVIPHPYTGYYFDPGKRPTKVNSLGFMGPEPLLDKGGEDRVIAITGGSVAAKFCHKRHLLTAHLKRWPALEDWKPRFLCIAVGGFKQPQQLLATAYFLSLGVKIDVLVNIDGFNEAVLPAAENVVAGVFPHYPRMWNRIISGRDLIEKGEAWRRFQAAIADFFGDYAPGYSPAAHLLWFGLDALTDERISLLRKGLSKGPDVRTDFFVKGPRMDVDRDLYEDAADVWFRSSVQLNSLAQGAGFAYLHFLQPNQYLGRKSLTAEEIEVAYDPEHFYAVHVVPGYARLIDRAAHLRRRGIDFHDLTDLFEGVDETLYIDVCCHFNDRGDDILAERVAATIASRFTTEATAGPGLSALP